MVQSNNYMLELDQVSKTFKNKTLLHSLSYHLEKGRILTLCGGNGAGKSTLIRLIVGLMLPSTGTVSINGITRRKRKTDFVNQFGYMPDDFKFQRLITAKETIHFYAKLKRVSQDRVNEVLQKVGLFDEQHKNMGVFSKGMTQRLLLGQALLQKPPLLILDEPTNGLDPYWIHQFEKLMIDAREAGQTVIFSTHDLQVAEKIADEVIFLSNGEVISEGRIEEYRKVGLYETFRQLYFEISTQA